MKNEIKISGFSRKFIKKLYKLSCKVMQYRKDNGIDTLVGKNDHFWHNQRDKWWENKMKLEYLKAFEEGVKSEKIFDNPYWKEYPNPANTKEEEDMARHFVDGFVSKYIKGVVKSCHC